jgi:N-acetylmuramoyl-L-alanine amidase
LADAAQDRARSSIERCREQFRIFIDVGHYRAAPGATSARGRPEFDFNLRLGQTLANTLTAAGFRHVRLFVSQGGADSLQKRAKESEKFGADVFISIHHDDVQDRYKSTWVFDFKENLYSDKFKGYSLFVSKLQASWPESVELARLISDEFMHRGMAFTAHHAEQIDGERRPPLDQTRALYQYDELIVLKTNTAPAVLIEAGVIANRDEELILGSQLRRNLFSNAVAEAVQSFCVAKRSSH